MSLTLLHIFYQVLLVLSLKDIKQPRKLEIVSLSRGQSSQFFLEQNHFSSVTQSCPTLCDPVDCSMPGLPVHHQHPELAQTHVH